jgi:hypothetical protein
MGHRKAARSVLEGYPPSCDAWQGRAFGHASASHDPCARRERTRGGPVTNTTPNPTTWAMLNPRVDRRSADYSSAEPTPLSRA